MPRLASLKSAGNTIQSGATATLPAQTIPAAQPSVESLPLFGRLRRHVACYTSGTIINCGYLPTSPQCQCGVSCPTQPIGQPGGPGGGGGGGGSAGGGGGGGGANPGGGSGGNPIQLIGWGPRALEVNLANAQTSVDDPAPLTIYNPKGPGVSWSVRYDSLRGSDLAYDFQDLGASWAHSYSFGMYDPNLSFSAFATPGGSVNINNTGTDAPATGLTWDIVQNGSTIASSSAPNGWSAGMMYSGPVVTVTPPASASATTNLELRYYGGSYFGNLSAFFDVLVRSVPQGSNAPIAMNGNNSPTGGVSWQIVRNGVTVATSTVPNGWNAAQNGQGGQSGITVTAPGTAALGTGYEARVPSYYNMPCSATFTLTSARMVPKAGTRYLYFPNGARTAVSAPSVPTATQPNVNCTVAAGFPYLVQWNYAANNPAGSYTVTQADRSRWTLGQSSLISHSGHGGQNLNYSPTQIQDENGNAINLNYATVNNALVLTSITDSASTALLTVNRDATSGLITSVADRYNRSIYYHVGTYQTGNVPQGNPQSLPELDHISQIVPTGTASPPDRLVGAYQNISNGEASEQIPILTGLSAPSPTGTGTVSASISYQTGTCFVTGVTDSNGNTTSFTAVDANHTQVTMADAGNNIAYRYTAGFDMNMSQTTATNGTLDANGHNTQIVASSTYADANNPLRPSSIVDAVGYAAGGLNGQGTTSKTWDQFGNCLTMTSARGTTTTLSYNYTNFALGEMTSVQEGAKTPTTFSYFEPSGLIQTMTRAKPGTAGQANQTVSYSYTYDSLGNMLTASGPGNNATATETVTLGYTTDGGFSQTEAINQPLTKTDSLGHVKHYRYDSLGRCTARIDALGNETDTVFNLVGQGTSVTFPATGETGTGRAQVVNTFLYPGGPQTSLTQYNEAGTQVYQENTTYGKEGEQLIRTGSTQPVTQSYDALYRLKTVVDGNSHSTQYSYNQAGYPSQISYPNGDTLQITSYDLNGNPLSRTDGRGVVTNLMYADVESRLTNIAYPASASLNVAISYDSYGRKSGLTDGSGSQSVNYDDLSQPTSVTTTYTGLAAQTLSYAYNPDGSRSSLTLPDATSYSDSYDAAGRHVGLTNTGGHTFSWSYANNDWLTQQNSDGTLVTTPTRDNRGFVTNLSNNRNDMMHTQLSNFALSLNTNMSIGSVTSSVSGVAAFSGTTNYTHDTKFQLTQESSTRAGSYINNNAFDSAGNPTTFKGVSQTFNTANQNNTAGAGYAYDSNGNPTSYKGNTLTFDVENRLTAYGTLLTAGYRSDGQRAWKQNSGGTTYYFYDGDKLLYETNSAGTITAKNTWGDTGLLARSTPTRTLLYSWDAQGNVCQQLDASTGNVVESYMFDAFGTRGTNGSDTAAMADPYAGFGGNSGYYTDSETGLQLCGHRYLDPTTGRFLTRDPISYVGGVNLYECVGNSPLGGNDASGLMSFGEWWKCFKKLGDPSEWKKQIECLSGLAKVIIQIGNGSQNCIGTAVCQFLLNCVLDTALECACEVLLSAMNPIAAGCICGLIEGVVHYVVDLGCEKLNLCNTEEKKKNPWCPLFNIIASFISGCAGGSLGKGDIIAIIKRFLISLGFDLGSDMLCGT